MFYCLSKHFIMRQFIYNLRRTWSLPPLSANLFLNNHCLQPEPRKRKPSTSTK